MYYAISSNMAGLPATIPTHFVADGTPNAYGPREALWSLLYVSLGLYALLSVMGYFVSVSKAPPKGPVTLGRIESLLGWTKAEAVWTIAYLVWGTIETAMGDAKGLDPALATAPVIVIMATIVLHVVPSSRQGRNNSDRLAV